MSYRAYPGCGDFVERDFVTEHIPVTFGSFLGFLDSCGVSLDDFAQYNFDGYEDIFDESVTDEQITQLKKEWDKVQKAFKSKTGLELSLCYLSEECEGDTETGTNFIVDGVYELTEAGKCFKGKIQHKGWVVFG